MPMYNFLEYSNNYSKTSGSLWNYYKDELTDETNDDNGLNKNLINSKYFPYKTNITGSTYNVAATAGDYDANKEGTRKAEIAVSLKHLSNFFYISSTFTQFDNKNHNHQVGIFLFTWDLIQQEPAQRGY